MTWPHSSTCVISGCPLEATAGWTICDGHRMRNSKPNIFTVWAFTGTICLPLTGRVGLVCCQAERFVGEALCNPMGFWQVEWKVWPLEAGDGELWLVWPKPGVTGAWPTTPARAAWGDRGAGFWGLRGPSDFLWDKELGEVQSDFGDQAEQATSVSQGSQEMLVGRRVRS